MYNAPTVILYFCGEQTAIMLRLAFFILSSFVIHLGVSQDSLSNEQQSRMDQSDKGEQANFPVFSTNSDGSDSQSMWDSFPENRFIDSLRDDTLTSRFHSSYEMQFPSGKTFHLGVSQDSLGNEQQPRMEQSDKDEQSNFSLFSTNSYGSYSQSMWDYFPENRFIDSLRDDALISRFRSPFEMQFPSEKTFNRIDPYDPYMMDSFTRNPRAKSWFFLVSLFVILHVLYFKAVYPKQFQLRIQSLFRPYFFEDLMREQQIASFTGSLHAYVIGMMVFLLGINMYVLSLDYTRLNHVLVYFLVFTITAILLFGLYAVQLVFTRSLEISHILSRQLQRQINVNLLLAIVFLPLFLMLYYNGSGWVGDDLFKQMYYVPIFWLSVRFIFQIYGIIQDRQGLLSSFLYFCALEIIPYLLLIKYFETAL